MNLLKSRGKSFFCEETASRIKIPLESNYMFNNLGYYFRRYKTERTAYCLLLTSSSLFFLLLFFFSLKVPICFVPEPVLVKCLNSILYTLLITEHCFFITFLPFLGESLLSRLHTQHYFGDKHLFLDRLMSTDSTDCLD